jgi:phospholipid transport system transporter-binding protein
MSHSFTIQRQAEEGAFLIAGELTLATANSVLTKSRSEFAQAEVLNIDLADVTRADSAALALLVSWMRLAKQSDKHIQFQNLPAQMLAIAKASGLDAILPVN